MRLARDQGLSSILFDQRLYEARVSSTMVTSSEGGARQVTAKIIRQPELAESEAVETLDTLEEKMPVRMSDLLLKGDEAQIKRIIKSLIQGLLQGPLQTRQKVVNRCHGMLEGLNLGMQNQLAKLMAAPLLVVFSQEEDPIILRELANLLHRLTTILLQFSEYASASRILLHLYSRHQKLLEARSEQATLLKKILLRPLEPKAQQLILEDFRSGEPSRQQNAAQLLGSLRRVSLPLLINIIKNEDDLRVRQMAATLLAEQGIQAVKLLKRELVLKATPDESIRILEIIDSVTRDLRTELAYALDDDDARVRQAALQLAERLNDDQVEKLLLEQAENEKVHVGVAAIKSLGKFKSRAAIAKLVSILQSTKNRERQIACCQALGLIANSASIEPLGKLLASKGFLRRRRQSAEVRATAALALAQIDHPRAAEVLAHYVNDSDPRVREVANSLKLSPATTPKKKLAAAK